MKPVYTSRTAPCSAACPAGEDIPHIEHLVLQGQFKGALETILKENPFPAICGHVCFHPCESACNRSHLDTPLAINAIERFVGSPVTGGKMLPWIQKKPPNGKHVAVIGAGPSGLSAAYFLCRLGYGCDVYESEKEPGGLLRWGIPAYRLPKAILNHEIERIKKLGVQIHCGHKVSASFIETAAERYHAVYAGCGQGRPIRMQIAGNLKPHDGLTFLKDIRAGKRPAYKGLSAVIGGGNTALDVARSLVRLGSHPIIIYRRRMEDMPAYGQEIGLAQQEGIGIRELTIPVRMAKDKQGIALGLQKMALDGLETNNGRARVTPIPDEEETLYVQDVFSAIGAEVENVWQAVKSGNESNLSLSHSTLTNHAFPMAYGGDLVNQVLSVSDAIASGKQAAMALDSYFQAGWKSIEKRLADCRIGQGPALSMECYLANDVCRYKDPQIVGYQDINPAYFQPGDRAEPTIKGPADRITSFSDYQSNFRAQTASHEAGRCFNCGFCNDCDNCRLFCPETAVFIEDARKINMDYCKGCGICVEECPRSAMTLEETDDETGS
jgi:NADPH-dependent glutamate synthase beta subunit-like oxidoreductase/Pyruvate/2-oxoacid:ferredoxin oxidoreductase delta subunit